MKGLKIGNLESMYPIMQGGMGVGISLGNLAGNVSKCGGMGSICPAQIGYYDAEYEKSPLSINLRVLGNEIEKAKEISNGGIIAVNIMYATKNYEQYVKAAVESNADIIISGAGLPIELPELVKGSDVKIIPIVSSDKAAKIILRMWDKKYRRNPNAIIIEGPLAGGHLGFHADEVLGITKASYDEKIKKIIDTVKTFSCDKNCDIPIIVAGGITDKEDVDRYRKLGADGFQIATKFITTEECDADIRYKEAFIKCDKDDIIIVKSPVGMPGRAIRNKFTDYVRENKIPVERCRSCIKTCNPKETQYCISQALINAVRGNVDDGLIFCGANAYMEDKIRTVKEVMEELVGYIELSELNCCLAE